MRYTPFLYSNSALNAVGTCDRKPSGVTELLRLRAGGDVNAAWLADQATRRDIQGGARGTLLTMRSIAASCAGATQLSGSGVDDDHVTCCGYARRLLCFSPSRALASGKFWDPRRHPSASAPALFSGNQFLSLRSLVRMVRLLPGFFIAPFSARRG